MGKQKNVKYTIGKQNNVKFLDMTVINVPLAQAEKEVMELFQRARELGKDKVHVEISLSEERMVGK